MRGIALSFAAAAVCAAAPAAVAQDARTFDTEGGRLRVETVASGLENPWGLAFLPDGRALITERGGRLRIVARDGRVSDPVQGLPDVAVRSQGGLLDVALARDFATSGTVFLCHAAQSETGLSTALVRARLDADSGRLSDVRRIFTQTPALSRGQHFGCRIVPLPDGTIALTLGDFFSQLREAQNLGNTIGKVVRIAADGSIPPDNPFVGRQGVHPAIYTYGHRNVQGATLGPDGAIWVSEHGARGGDEINRLVPGRNYGWPVITYSLDYSGAVISNETARPGMEQPVHHWVNTDTIAPSGAAFVTSDRYPAWRGNLLVGGLRSQVLVRLVVENGRVTREERLLRGFGERIRAVVQAPDGVLHVITDGQRGRLLRLTLGG